MTEPCVRLSWLGLVYHDFQAGELVAYWREQKGQWHGTAMVIGKVGRNFIIAHRSQVLRFAPEQLRPATTEEKASVATPEAELLGIKDFIEGGTFRGQQYVDLLPGHYPPSAVVLSQPMEVDSRLEEAPGQVEPSALAEAPSQPPAQEEPLPYTSLPCEKEGEMIGPAPSPGLQPSQSLPAVHTVPSVEGSVGNQLNKPCFAHQPCKRS